MPLRCFQPMHLYICAQGFSKGVIEHLVGVLTAAPRLLKHPTIAPLLSDPVGAAIIPSNRNSSMGGNYSSTAGGTAGPGCGFFLGCGADQQGSSSSSPEGGGRGSNGGAEGPRSCSSAVVSHSALRVSAAAAVAVVPLPLFVTDAEGEGGHRLGGQLLLMVVGGKELQNLRRALDSHVSAGAVVWCCTCSCGGAFSTIRFTNLTTGWLFLATI